MNDPVDFELLKTLVESDRDETRGLRGEILGMREEIREGFAGLRAHDHAAHADHQQLERRVADLELAVERLSTAAGINADDRQK